MLPAQSAKRCQRPCMGERFATNERDTFDVTLRLNLIEQTFHCRLVASIERPSCAIGAIRPFSPGPGAELSRKGVFSGMLLRVVWYPRMAFCGFVLIGLVFFRTHNNL